MRVSFLSPAPLSAALARAGLAKGLFALSLAACAAAPDPGAAGGTAGGTGGAAASGGAIGSGGVPSTGGTPGSGGTSGGAAGTGSGGSASGGTSGGTGSGGSSGGATGTGGASSDSGGSGTASDCTPNPAGTFVVSGEVVFDETTCLSWMQENATGQPYAEATTYCADLSLGGYEDWRIPTAGEVVSIFKCLGTFPPVEDVFTVVGDGIWTTTETGTIAGDLPKVCGAGQSSGQYYDYGQVGPQNTRCVRGESTLPDRTDCKTNTSICP